MFGDRNNRHVISINDFSKDALLELISFTSVMKSNPEVYRDSLVGWKAAEMFISNSTRTFESFREAAEDLGAKARMGFRSPSGTSLEKGESVVATGQMYRGYGADVIITRSPHDGAALYLADALDVDFETGLTDKRVWVIDGGTGNKDHSTQNMLDLYTFREQYGKLDGLNCLVFGDLLYGRSIRFVLPLSLFGDLEVTFLSHPRLALADDIRGTLTERGVKFQEIFDPEALPDVLPTVDFVYGSRNQENRYPETAEGEELKREVRDFAVINRKMMESIKPKDGFKIYHALPVDRKHPCIVEHEIDRTSYCGYIKEAENGYHLRKALLYRMRHD
ncbi:MAG: hypothetical protein ISS36_03225 [Candidatus Aenigmarchaeota archaeon]|nr:hypothetical protein [Candidatus Aenigmarchaeota archaeon]